MWKKQFILFLTDVSLILASIVIAGIPHFNHVLSHGSSKGTALSTYTGASVFTLCATISFLYISGLYDLKLLKSRNKTIFRTLTCTISSNIAVAAWFYIIGHWQFPIALFGIQLIISSIFLSSIRYTMPLLLRISEKNNTILVGFGSSGQEIYSIIKNEVVCILDDNKAIRETAPVRAETCQALSTLINDLQSKKVIIAIGGHLNEDIMLQLIKARLNGVYITTMAAEYERRTRSIPVRHIQDRWIALEDGFSLYAHPYIRRCKRLSDTIISLIGISLSLPLCLICALLIKLESRGPIIFKQTRIGYLNRPFTVYKLRSMAQDAEKNGAQWASKNDVRVTTIGKFIRRTRIDELPQFFNVLKGDMSLIGPRPEQPAFVTTLEQKIPYYYMRHTIKPGLSGWAQINYPYGANTEDALRKLEYELYYIKNMSILLDLKIALKTLGVMLFGQGGR